MDKQALAQQPYLTFFQDDTAEYDVIVDQSSSAPNLKEATWGAIQPLLPIIGEALGPDEMALILEYSPMPESFLEKFKAIQEQKAMQPPPPDPEMMKVEAMKQAKAAELEMKQQEAQIDMQLEKQKTAAQLQLEEQKAAAEIQLEREKAAAQLELEKQKAAVSMTMEREKMDFEQERQKGEMDLKAQAARSDMAIKSGHAKMGAEEEKALSTALTQMAQAMIEMAKSNAESQRMMADSVASFGSEIKEAMTKPKQIVRGPDGRAIGVQ